MYCWIICMFCEFFRYILDFKVIDFIEVIFILVFVVISVVEWFLIFVVIYIFFDIYYGSVYIVSLEIRDKIIGVKLIDIVWSVSV